VYATILNSVFYRAETQVPFQTFPSRKFLPIKLLSLQQLLVIHTFAECVKEKITQHFDLHGSIHSSSCQVNVKPDFSTISNWSTFLYV